MKQNANPGDQPVNDHYSRPGVVERILEAMRAAGKDVDALTIEDLAPADQFHIGGFEYALRLATRAGLSAGMEVLDIGGGIGGPARLLARDFGCRVTVIDLTEEFCRAGEELTRLTGLDKQVSFQLGNALEMPFAAGSFDLVWTQHGTMNIADKERLYAEIHRVLRPGGSLAFHEFMAGRETPIYFPVPWAREQSISHLRRPDEVRALIKGLGFQELIWEDETELSLAWAEQRMAAARNAPAGPPAMGLSVILGDEFNVMFGNVVRGLKENRLAVVQAVFAAV